MTTRCRRAALPLLAALCTLTVRAAAQTGYSASQGQRQRSLEQLLVTLGDTGRARRHSKALSAVPHVAGTPAQQATARYVLEQMRSFGLDTSRADFQVYIPHPESTVVEIVWPQPTRLALEEPPLAEDSSSQRSIWPVMNGHAAPGDVTAPLVFVNYGLIEDYKVLDSLGISVKGKIAIARYGRSFRGIKAREAEAHGAVALLIYSDPQDDGYVVGDIYPEGPMRPPQGVQRGSILNISGGDPATPGWPALKGAKRLSVDSMDLPRIPVVPIGYGNAARLLEPLRGEGAPTGWQGGLPFRYHIGAGEVVARVALFGEPLSRSFKTITNTFGVLRGTDFPDELVIIGGHRDAWGPGAVDNVSGVVSILEAARMLGEAAKRGFRPRRTIMFATWDAEEWGLMGSSEWVEAREGELAAKGVVYLNLDVAVSGSSSFGASGTASLHPLLRQLSRQVAQPYDTTSIYDAWRRRARVADTADVNLGDLGGGSDFAGFYNHLGIASAGFGFGGPGGVYHSAYDSYDWMRRFGDSTYQAHVAAGELAALFLARMANADLEPFDFKALAGRLSRLVTALPKTKGVTGPVPDTTRLSAAVRGLDRAATVWQSARESGLTGTPARAALVRANEKLRQVERELIRPAGLLGRPWLRNLVFASDRDNGYADVPFPSIVEAWRAGNADLVTAEVNDLVDRLTEATTRLTEAASVVNSAR
ncbi:MAG: M20/M25/M40 family metallo-hydrolase [Gemmatimonadales bacterium]